uniref:Superfamily II DNA/RNA helicase n=1 Tax=Clandestinovirus TaxID=2831644 RepID=A0A8F8PJZ3_9VIRU|nr:superfamily II DNA/RNA helicase [Clandestinovirus]
MATNEAVVYDFPQTTETMHKFLDSKGLIKKDADGKDVEDLSRAEMLMILYRHPKLLDEFKNYSGNTLVDPLPYALIENVPGHGLGLSPGEKPRILQWIESGLITWDELIKFIPSQPSKKQLADSFRQWAAKNYTERNVNDLPEDVLAAAEIQRIVQYGDPDLRRYIVLHIVTKFWQGIPIPDTEGPEGTVSFSDWQDEVNKRFGAFVAPEMCNVETAINGCTTTNGVRQKRIYQQMLQYFYTLETSQRIRGMLLCWNVGAGKTCGLHAMAANFYRKNLKMGYGPNHPDRWRLIWVTRRNLLSVPDSEEFACFRGTADMTMKNAYEVMSITQLFNMLRSFFNISGLVTNAAGDTKLVEPYSKNVDFGEPLKTQDGKYVANYGTNKVFARYRDSSREPVLNSWLRDPKNRDLRTKDPVRADTDPMVLDPLYRTVIIFDEFHLLYDATVIGNELGVPDQKDQFGKVTMRGGQMVFEGLRNMLFHSYRISGMDSARFIASTATPFSEDDPMRFPKLLNAMIADPDKRLPETFDAFSAKYFSGPNNEYIKPEAFVKDFLLKTRGLISYLDNKNPGEFAQLEGGKPQIELVPMNMEQYSVVLKCLAGTLKKPQMDEPKDIDTTQLEANLDPEEMVKRVICTRHAAMYAAGAAGGAFSISAPTATIDREVFDPSKLKEELPLKAPKIKKIIDTIKKIDAEYAATHDGKKPKHVIFSGYSKGWGGKAIASALAAYGGFREMFFEDDEFIENKCLPEQPCPDGVKNRELSTDPLDTFTLLTTSRYYNNKRQIKASYFQKRKDWQRKTIKDSKWNTMEKIIGHPENLNGEKIRIIILSGNMSEGVSMKETLFMHLAESAITDQKEQQILGRVSRSCGHKYHGFIQGRGFPNVRIIIYKDILPNDRMFVHRLPDGTYAREDPLQFAKRIYRNAIPMGPDEPATKRENETIENFFKNCFEMMVLSSFDRQMNMGFNCALSAKINSSEGRMIRSIAQWENQPQVQQDDSERSTQAELQNLLNE